MENMENISPTRVAYADVGHQQHHTGAPEPGDVTSNVHLPRRKHTMLRTGKEPLSLLL